MTEQEMQYTCTSNFEARSCNCDWRGKAISIIYFGFASVDLIIQRAKRIALLQRHLWPDWLYNIFPHYLIKKARFQDEVSKNKICVLIFSTIFSEILLILRIVQ
jgi:hypothetical protein